MLKKLFYNGSLIFLCYFLAGCHHGKTNRKNNDTRLKSASVLISTKQMDSSKTIAENILADTSYSILAESLKSTDLFDILTKPGPFTIFAPSNTAFRKLPAGTLEAWMTDRKTDLSNILSYHVIAGRLRSKDIESVQKLKTLAGEALIITKKNKNIMSNGIKINLPGVEARNGIIYPIDDLLFPTQQNPGAY